MNRRPAIGERVKLRRNVGVPRVAGKLGTVIGHHRDGIAIQVRVDGDRRGQRPFTCDWPVDVSSVRTQAKAGG